MAASVIVTTKIDIAGIGDDIHISNEKTLATVPVELKKGYTIMPSTFATVGIELLANVTDIPLAKVFGVYIKAEVGTIFITVQQSGVDAATYGTALTSDLKLLVGESVFIPYNGGRTAAAGILVSGSATSDAFSYIILGSA